mmetsp:Transcript_78335/g.227276  ORF Transcript_78335/g.227276 Transcript_78335/m.227276 type:complete len:296 (+) Transcript_78335:860-1747(+)
MARWLLAAPEKSASPSASAGGALVAGPKMERTLAALSASNNRSCTWMMAFTSAGAVTAFAFFPRLVAAPSKVSSASIAGAATRAVASCSSTAAETPTYGDRPAASAPSPSGARATRCSRWSTCRTTNPKARGQRSQPGPKTRSSPAFDGDRTSAMPFAQAPQKALLKASTTCLSCAASVLRTALLTSGSRKAASTTIRALPKSSATAWRRPNRAAAANNRSQAASITPPNFSQRTATSNIAANCGNDGAASPPLHAITSSCCTSCAVRCNRAGSSEERAKRRSSRNCVAAPPSSS